MASCATKTLVASDRNFAILSAYTCKQGTSRKPETFGTERLENQSLLVKSSYYVTALSNYMFRSCPNKKMIMTVGFLHWRYGTCTSVYLTAMNMLVLHMIDGWVHCSSPECKTQPGTCHIKHVQYTVESPHSLLFHRERWPGFIMRCCSKSSVDISYESIQLYAYIYYMLKIC